VYVKVTPGPPPSNGIGAVTNGILLPLKGGIGTAGIGSIHVTVKSPHVITGGSLSSATMLPQHELPVSGSVTVTPYAPGVVITLPPPVTFTIYSS